MRASTSAENQAVSPLIDARRDRQATEKVEGRANIPTKKLLSATSPNASSPTSEPIRVQSGSPENAANVSSSLFAATASKKRSTAANIAFSSSSSAHIRFAPQDHPPR